MSAFAQIYFYWVTNQDKITLKVGATGSQNLKYTDRYTVDLNGLINFQITRSVGVNASVTYGYSPASMTYPKEPDFSNSLQTAFLSGGQSGASLSYLMGVNLRLGNSLRKIRDRRWD